MSHTLDFVARLLDHARDLTRQGRTDDARRLFQRLAAFPNLADADTAAIHRGLARLAVRQRHFKQARQHLKQVLQVRPKDAVCRYLYAVALEYDKHAPAERIEREFRLALKLAPEKARWRAVYGQFLLRCRKTSAGLRQLKQAVALHPTDVRLAVKWVRGLWSAGRDEIAARELTFARFRFAKNPVIGRLWVEMRLREVRQKQQAGQTQHTVEVEPTILPFLRLAGTEERPSRPATEGGILRHDQSTASVPHLPRALRARTRRSR